MVLSEASAFITGHLLTFFLASLLALFLPSLLTFRLTFFAYLLTFCLAFFLAYLLTFFLALFPAFCLTYLLTLFLRQILCLAVAVWQGTLAADDRGWGPAGYTGWTQMAKEDEEDGEQEEGEEMDWRNNPHLTGGGRIVFLFGWKICPETETNIAPENGWLEDYFLLGEANFQGLCLVFGEGTSNKLPAIEDSSQWNRMMASDSLGKSICLVGLHKPMRVDSALGKWYCINTCWWFRNPKANHLGWCIKPVVNNGRFQLPSPQLVM